AVVARIHHARTPENFNPALARARGEPLDEVAIPRKRPKWAVDALSGAKSGASPTSDN
ncbi:MAG: hypothetical protein ACJA0Y_000594, partial [Maricaulis maris]